MSAQTVMDILAQSTWIAIQCAGPLLMVGVSVGLLMGLLQAATQISEPSLTFVPKLAALAAGLAMFGPWVLERMTTFSRDMFDMIGALP